MKAPSLWNNRGLTQRIICYILLVAAVPIVLIALFAFRAGSRGIREHTELHLTSIVIVKAQEVERWFRPLEATARIVAGNSEVKAAITRFGEPADGLESTVANAMLLAYLNDMLKRQAGLRGIALVSADSNAVVLRAGEDAPFDPLAIPMRSQSESLVSLYLPPYVRESGAPQAAIAAPVARDGKVFGRIVLLASPLPLYETLSPDAGLGAEGKVYLVNREGDVLTPPQRLPDLPGVIRASPVLTEMSDRPGRGLEYVDFLGTEVTGAYQPIESLGWGVVAELPTSVAFQEINQMRWVIGGAAASFFLLLAGVAILITRHVTSPVRALAEGARHLGSGELGYRIRVNSGDELGLLANSFNQMAQDLTTAQTRMVEAERTAALQVFTEQKVGQLKQLSRLGLLTATESSLEGLIQTIPALARNITKADVAGLVILSEADGRIEHAGHTETVSSDLVSRLLSDPRFFQLLTEGKSVNHQGSTGRDSCDAESCAAALHEFNAVVSVPLHTETNGVAGAIFIANLTQVQGFPQEDEELVQIVAGYVSAALQKMRKEVRLQLSEQEALAAVQELKSAQAQLVQAQKMESVGRLAGGVAHDFNNLLTPIMAYAQMGIRAAPPGETKLRANLLEIQTAAERAANLTRQLLAFSRRQIIEPRVIILNELILNMEKMLRRLIGEDIELVALPGADLGHTKVDPGQIEQVLMNLAVNARDAMPGGGKLTIETANVTIDEEYARLLPPLTAGDYVMLAVTDNGTGMTDEVKAHIFEPFFTTKQEGKGTGLGLAMCYGIVHQSKGHIAVYSEVGQGTTFRVFLPRAEEEAGSVTTREDNVEMPRGTETVLLVEDEPSVRQLAAFVLREQGYKVLEAANGIEALKAAQDYTAEIHLLLTDVVMPGMSGKELADRLKAIRPDLRALFTSGYTDDAIVKHGVLNPGIAFIPKPFSAKSLAFKARETLDQRRVTAA